MKAAVTPAVGQSVIAAVVRVVPVNYYTCCIV